MATNGTFEFCPNASWGFRKTEEFESAWGSFLKTDVAAVSSGYTALFLALKALGVKHGDEVIVPDFTMVATANAVLECGAKPVFVGVDDNGNIDAEKTKQALTSKTVGVVAVHIYGLPADVDGLREVVGDRWILEDAAEAHGATSKGRLAGTLGDAAAFSHYHNKLVSTGEGGSVSATREGLVDTVRSLRSYCFGSGYAHDGIGYGMRMNPYGAQHGIEDVQVLDDNIWERAYVAAYYDEQLDKRVIRPKKTKGRVYWMYGIRVKDRDTIRESLTDAGVPTREFFQPMTLQPHFKGETDPMAKQLWREGILLPIIDMNEDKLWKVVSTINKSI